MIPLPEFSDLQKRAVYIVLASSIAVGSLFVTLSQGKASSAKPIATVPLSVSQPTVLPSVAQLVVDVSGKVLHPGVYTLPQGSRAIDAIKAAGNQLRGVSMADINLAHLLTDGEQILVGTPVVISTVKKGKSSSTISKSSTVLVSINTSSLQQLQVLKGIGPVTAKKVMAYRKLHGSFTLIDDFKKASGMGLAKFAAIKKQLRL